MEANKIFIENRNLAWEELGQGVRRMIVAHDEKLMLVKVEFEKGAIGALHHHPHVQITHVESGVFEVEVKEDKRVLSAGDAFYVPSNEVHGVVCLEAGVLIDVFSPRREDFL